MTLATILSGVVADGSFFSEYEKSKEAVDAINKQLIEIDDKIARDHEQLKYGITNEAVRKEYTDELDDLESSKQKLQAAADDATQSDPLPKLQEVLEQACMQIGPGNILSMVRQVVVGCNHTLRENESEFRVGLNLISQPACERQMGELRCQCRFSLSRYRAADGMEIDTLPFDLNVSYRD